MISYTTSNFLLFSISYTLSKFRKQSYFFLRLMNLGHSKIMWWILGQILYKYFVSKVCPVIIFVNFFFFVKCPLQLEMLINSSFHLLLSVHSTIEIASLGVEFTFKTAPTLGANLVTLSTS